MIDENKKFVISRLRQFEQTVVQQLKQATGHLDLKAFDESLEKVESDFLGVAKEIGLIKQNMLQERE